MEVDRSDRPECRRLEEQRGQDDDGNRQEASKCHPEAGDEAIGHQVTLIPLLLNRAGTVEVIEIGRDRRAEDAHGDEPVVRGLGVWQRGQRTAGNGAIVRAQLGRGDGEGEP
jgi:hypothetical protein